MRKLVLNQITLCADGSIQVQWLKQVLDPDSGEVLFSEPHRTAVDLDGDIDAQIAAVSEDLERRGYGEVPASNIARIKKIDAIGKSDPDIASNRAAAIASRNDRAKEDEGSVQLSRQGRVKA